MPPPPAFPFFTSRVDSKLPHDVVEKSAGNVILIRFYYIFGRFRFFFPFFAAITEMVAAHPPLGVPKCVCEPGKKQPLYRHRWGSSSAGPKAFPDR